MLALSPADPALSRGGRIDEQDLLEKKAAAAGRTIHYKGLEQARQAIDAIPVDHSKAVRMAEVRVNYHEGSAGRGHTVVTGRGTYPIHEFLRDQFHMKFSKPPAVHDPTRGRRGEASWELDRAITAAEEELLGRVAHQTGICLTIEKLHVEDAAYVH